MFDYTNYAQVFGQEPFVDRGLVGDADALRRALDGELFIERVLKATGIVKPKSYPPKSDKALKSLHAEICESKMNTNHRLSILYYMLLDLAPQKVPAVDHAGIFAQESGLPKRYQTFMKGLYYLDKHQFTRSLDYITHPCLIPDFTDAIVIVLAKNSPPNDPTTLLSYFYTVNPQLKTPRALSLLFKALSLANVTTALNYLRTYPDATRELLFGQMVGNVVDAAGSNEGAEKAVELISLVLTEQEENWFEEYLTHGQGKTLMKARDTLVMRKIATGRYKDAVEERGVSSQWGGVLEGVKNGLGQRI